MSHIIIHKVVFKIISRNLLIVGAALLICAGVAAIYSEDILPFVLPSLLALSAGALLHFLSAREKGDLTVHKKDTYFTVTLSWLTIGAIGCLPYLISGAIPSAVNALFESVSGFTTTGSSILTDIEALPKSILFWRSLTHWIGGIGIIVLVIIIMPSMKIGGYQFFTLESSLQEKIQPRTRSVGYRLLAIYVGLTVIVVVLLLLGKMSLFESLCHAFGTVATGGFSPKNNSIAGYSAYIHYVVMIFMFLSGTNFIIHYYLMKREIVKIRSNEEFKLYFTLLLLVGSVITAILFFKMGKPLETSFREGFFQVTSIITCTGYATADYMLWPRYGWMILFFAMFLGGSTGSTAGGIKMARHLLLLKNIRNNFRQTLSPNVVVSIKLNKNHISPETNSSILTFITVYFMIFMIGTTLMTILGLDLQTSGSSVATCMAGIGPGIGSVGPASNFAHLPDAGKIILTLLMVIGRLEIFTVIVLLTPSFWKR